MNPYSLETSEVEIEKTKTEKTKGHRIICLLLLMLLLITAGFFLGRVILPDGYDYRTGFARCMMTILWLLWSVAAFGGMGALLVRISESEQLRNFEKAICKVLLVLAVFAAVILYAIWSFFYMILAYDGEMEVMDDHLLLMQTEEYEPTQYYNIAVGPFLRRNLTDSEKQVYGVDEAAGTSAVDTAETEAETEEAIVFTYSRSTEEAPSEEASAGQDIDANRITAEEYSHFQGEGTVEEFGTFDDFAQTLAYDFTGTWYDPELGEAFRITEDGAYVYIPYLDLYGEECYEWELIDRSADGLCPEIAIYYHGRYTGALVYYVAGARETYFWCNVQSQIFYRQE